MRETSADNIRICTRTFWLDTEGGEEGDGAWYWRQVDERGEAIPDTEPVGPFDNEIAAGRAAQRWMREQTDAEDWP